MTTMWRNDERWDWKNGAVSVGKCKLIMSDWEETLWEEMLFLIQLHGLLPFTYQLPCHGPSNAGIIPMVGQKILLTYYVPFLDKSRSQVPCIFRFLSWFRWPISLKIDIDIRNKIYSNDSLASMLMASETPLKNDVIVLSLFWSAQPPRRL